MEFKKEILKHKSGIERYLQEYLITERKKTLHVDPFVTKITDFVMEFCLRGGKRLRAVLMVKSYQGVGGQDVDEITRTSICMELMEGFLLIHDDIIDNDPIRRGGPSYHKMVENWTKDKNFGVSAGIMAGDMLAALGAQTIITSKFKDKNKLTAVREYNYALLSCFSGELYDVILEKKTIVSENQLMKMINLKTSSYTTAAPLVIGATLGETEQKRIELMREFGNLLGAAFQIKDDILGSFGNEEKLGKPANSDIRQGKKTLLAIYALQKSSAAGKQVLKKSLGNKHLTAKQFDEVREIFVESGALKYSKNKAKSYITKSKQVLKSAKLTKDSTKFLEALADYIIAREY